MLQRSASAVHVSINLAKQPRGSFGGNEASSVLVFVVISANAISELTIRQLIGSINTRAFIGTTFFLTIRACLSRTRREHLTIRAENLVGPCGHCSRDKGFLLLTTSRFRRLLGAGTPPRHRYWRGQTFYASCPTSPLVSEPVRESARKG